MRSEGNCIHWQHSSPSFTSATVCGSITRLGLYLINMSCQMVVVFCGISRSACTRKYRDASESRGKRKREGVERRKRRRIQETLYKTVCLYHCKNKIAVLQLRDYPSYVINLKESSVCKTFCGRLVKFIQVSIFVARIVTQLYVPNTYLDKITNLFLQYSIYCPDYSFANTLI